MKTSKKLLWGLIFATFIFGACLTGAGIALGGKLHDGFGLHFNSGFTTAQTHTVSIEEFSSVSIDLSIGDIEITEGDSYKLEIKNLQEDEYSIDMRGTTLDIKTDIDYHINLFLNHLDYKMTLTIPRDVELEDVILHSHMGDIELNDVDMESLKITQDMGDIDVYDVIIDGDCELLNKMGDIKFRGKSWGLMHVDNKMGDIKLSIEDEEADYSYDLSTNMGDIKLNGESLNDGFVSKEKGGNKDAKYHIEVDDRMGDIKLEFLK